MGMECYSVTTVFEGKNYAVTSGWMQEAYQIPVSMLDDSDPRTPGDYVRRLPGRRDDGDVIVAGVVHDHPASTYRVRSVIDSTDPDIVALELPPIAVPLFERYAAGEQTPPASGGEISAAIQAAAPSAVVGIDGPTAAFLWRLVGDIYRSEVGLSTVRTLLSGVISVIVHAIACRLAATFNGSAAFRSAVDSVADYDCDWSETPHQQAADERAHIRRAESVQNIFGESGAVRLRDAAREAHMADRIRSLRREGTVVAIVGVGHLDPLTELLD
jgi:pheromone shutdown protein TraB